MSRAAEHLDKAKAKVAALLTQLAYCQGVLISLPVLVLQRLYQLLQLTDLLDQMVQPHLGQTNRLHNVHQTGGDE